MPGFFFFAFYFFVLRLFFLSWHRGQVVHGGWTRIRSDPMHGILPRHCEHISTDKQIYEYIYIYIYIYIHSSRANVKHRVQVSSLLSLRHRKTLRKYSPPFKHTRQEHSRPLPLSPSLTALDRHNNIKPSQVKHYTSPSKAPMPRRFLLDPRHPIALRYVPSRSSKRGNHNMTALPKT